jgi:opacity protein-like surface antigen
MSIPSTFGNATGSADLGACVGAVCSYDQTLAGCTVGFGFKYDLSKSLVIRGDYLYSDLGDLTFSNPVTVTGRFKFGVVRVGLEKRF